MTEPEYSQPGKKEEEFDTSNGDTNLRTIKSHSAYEQTVRIFKNYIPKSTIIDIEALRQSPNIKIKKYKYTAFFGEIAAGKRHGLGIMLYSQQCVYEGEWRLDCKHGKGYELFSNGSTYLGQFALGKPEGIGMYNWANGQVYEGEWLNGLKHGSGAWRNPNNNTYVGQWKLGKPDGYGVYVCNSGDRYEGYFSDCLKHGKGVQRYSSGDIYKGNFQKGKPSGKGQYFWSNGSYYEGEFAMGVRQGLGVWASAPEGGDHYEGLYRAGKKEGKGVYTWTNGTKYKGQYYQDLRHGYGQMSWSDGSYYKGNWFNGERHGQATVSTRHGQQQCTFYHDIMISPTLQNDKNNAQQSKIQSPERANKLPKKSPSKEKEKSSTQGRFFNKNQEWNSRLKTKESNRKINQKLIQKKSEQIISRGHERAFNVHVKRTSQQKHHQKGMLLNREPYQQRRFISSQHESRRKVVPSLESQKHTVELCVKNSPYRQYKSPSRRQHIPHSSFYIHQMYKRVRTQNDQYCAQSQKDELGQSAVKPYNLTKLMHRFKLNHSSLQ